VDPASFNAEEDAHIRRNRSSRKLQALQRVAQPRVGAERGDPELSGAEDGFLSPAGSRDRIFDAVLDQCCRSEKISAGRNAIHSLHAGNKSSGHELCSCCVLVSSVAKQFRSCGANRFEEHWGSDLHAGKAGCFCTPNGKTRSAVGRRRVVERLRVRRVTRRVPGGRERAAPRHPRSAGATQVARTGLPTPGGGTERGLRQGCQLQGGEGCSGARASSRTRPRRIRRPARVGEAGAAITRTAQFLLPVR